MSTKKGLTTKALAKATKRLLEDIPSGIPKKKAKIADDSILSKKAANSLIAVHEQALKDNKALNRKINNKSKLQLVVLTKVSMIQYQLNKLIQKMKRLMIVLLIFPSLMLSLVEWRVRAL